MRDLLEIIRLRVEVACVGPLKLRLQRASDLPIGITQVVVDGRVFGLEFDCSLQVLDRLVVVADPEIRPSQRINNIGVVRALFDGALYHAHPIIQMHALIDPQIAQVVEHVRLIWV